MNVVQIRSPAETHPDGQAAFEAHRRRVLEVLPEAEVEHVGSTSIPGALTKGDVDLLVRVGEDRFEAAVDALRDIYAVHQPENWTPDYASFAGRRDAEPPVGVQLVVTGSPDDLRFSGFRAALRDDPELLAEYNALKRRYDGDTYERYTASKADFIERVLADAGERFRGSA